MESQAVPIPGEWPVDPQNDVKISEDRIWVDGCFDFAHHGLHTRRSQNWRLQRAYTYQDMLAQCYKLDD